MEGKEIVAAELVTSETAIVDVRVPFKSVFALTFKFWLAGLILGFVIFAALAAIGIGVGVLSFAVNTAVLGL